jgi:hypothetical protein
VVPGAKRGSPTFSIVAFALEYQSFPYILKPSVGRFKISTIFVAFNSILIPLTVDSMVLSLGLQIALKKKA